MTAAVVPVDASSLAAISPIAREAAVTQYLASARDWLARAVTETGPEQIAAAKAEIATAAEATKQLNLSKDIQLDAQEMVRRAEYALGKAIRKGQAEGRIRPSTGGDTRVDLDRCVDNTQVSPSEFASPTDLSGNGAGIYQMTDGVSEDQFEEALAEAKDEHNLSRANVVRKAKGKKEKAAREAVDSPARLDRIRELADAGLTSKQMAAEIGIGDEYVRRLARSNDIEIPADSVASRQRSVNTDRAIEQLVLELDSLAGTTEFMEPAAAGREHLQEWVNSLSNSLRSLNKFANQLKKELTH